jgi:hypothetical protein
MISEPKYQLHQNDHGRHNRQRIEQEEALDEALKNTFPASDPVSVEQPVAPSADAVAPNHIEDRQSNSDIPGKGRLAVQGGVLRSKGTNDKKTANAEDKADVATRTLNRR